MRIKNEENIRDLFLGIDEKVYDYKGNGINSINFDNAATTPTFKSNFLYMKKLSKTYASIGRGTGQKAEITTELYYESKKFLMDFFRIKNSDNYVVIYVNNTTEALNKLAKTLLKEEDEIVLVSRMEHHSNDLPWRNRGKVDYIEVDKEGRLRLEELEEKLKNNLGKIKYVSLTGASNVTGYINNIHEIAKIVHKYDAKLIVDAAQLVAHKKISISGNSKEEDIDFLVFSSHKIYSPFGIGVIIGLKEDFMNSLPDYSGGGTVELVLDNEVTYLKPPEKNEAGTPNFLGVMSLINSLKELRDIGYQFIEEHEKVLLKRMLQGLESIPQIINYGDTFNIYDRLGIAVFNINEFYDKEVAEILAKRRGIAVRHGWFCAHPYCRRLMGISEEEASSFLNDETKRMPGMIRVSFAVYNTEKEIDFFLNTVEDIARGKLTL
ncbi:aminotransferase class V-fold PLP-dependent enzyme [Clostridium botulinum]|uniref:aminotransferase class V-fold PLP-dependent enzyme n=1 Tax=Clostridium botulinum TaxID=1491 RepID=UPI0013C71BC9|nr:aminotransferase class V-fold PLP-dependent enzyme [Clostridium botulinum]MBN1041125.1 aminotransferase class V-fold PLP-dependent enzyme [Clostridium botulinum]NFN16972.1 aminotransferase class V-fold PLP-dependent enzyme [Clostridium botulinum]NFN50050.1 aminotransferase class V-fold PLP-dependent enzyme [Clostridium botulinum]